MTQSDDWSPEATAEFVAYIEYLRKQPPRPGFPRYTAADLAREQGVKPWNKEEILEISRRAGFTEDE